MTSAWQIQISQGAPTPEGRQPIIWPFSRKLHEHENPPMHDLQNLIVLFYYCIILKYSIV